MEELSFNSTQKCGDRIIVINEYCIMKAEWWVLLNSIKDILSYSDDLHSLEETVLDQANNQWNEMDQIISDHYENGHPDEN